MENESSVLPPEPTQIQDKGLDTCSWQCPHAAGSSSVLPGTQCMVLAALGVLGRISPFPQLESWEHGVLGPAKLGENPSLGLLPSCAGAAKLKIGPASPPSYGFADICVCEWLFWMSFGRKTPLGVCCVPQPGWLWLPLVLQGCMAPTAFC